MCVLLAAVTDALMEFEKGTTGIFYATNAYGLNSAPQIEFEDYWGSGHGRLFYDLYANAKGVFTNREIRST